MITRKMEIYKIYLCQAFIIIPITSSGLLICEVIIRWLQTSILIWNYFMIAFRKEYWPYDKIIVHDVALSADILIMEPLPNSFLSLRDVPGACFSIHSASMILRGKTPLSLDIILVEYSWWMPSWASLSCLQRGFLVFFDFWPLRWDFILQWDVI